MPALCSGLSLRSSPEHSASPSLYLAQQAATDGPELTATSGPRLLAKLMGEMKRAIARERVAWAEQMQEQTRMKSTLVIAAAIIAAVRLARDPDISRPSPRLTAVVSDSVSLARMILDRAGRQ